MEPFRKRTHSIVLKDDASTTELLPLQAASGSYDAAPLKDGHDRVEEQSHKGKLVIKDWPGHASSLGDRGWRKAGLLTVDYSIALIPLLFIGKSQTVRTTRTRAHNCPCSLADNNSPECRGDIFVGLACRTPRQ